MISKIHNLKLKNAHRDLGADLSLTGDFTSNSTDAVVTQESENRLTVRDGY